MQWQAEFERWFIAGFLSLNGLLLVWRGPALSACSRFFFLELREPQLKERFRRVLDRRTEIEGERAPAWRTAGLLSLLFGVLVFWRALQPVVGYALLCATLAIVMSQIYMSMRNRSVRRAASLQPRTPTSSVPALWYAGAVVSAILPLALVGDPNLRVAAAVVSLACAAIVVVAARTSDMAALLAGDDPDIEVYVDNRLRWSRVSGLLALAYASSVVFIAMSTPSLRMSPPPILVLQLVSRIAFLGFAAWAVWVFFRGRMHATAKEKVRVT